MRRSLVLLVCVMPLLVFRPGAASAVNGSLRTYGSHVYRVADVGNMVEASMAASPDGTVWTAGNGEANWLYKTTNKGVTWNPVRHPGLRGLLNEGDVAVAPSGDVYVSWLDLSRLESSRVYVSRDKGESFAEKLLVGPQVFPDRPWVVAGYGATPGSDIAIVTASATGTREWGSTDRGETWLQQTVVKRNMTQLEPPITPDAFMDFASPAFAEWVDWIALPGGGLLNKETGAWTKDFQTWHEITPFTGPVGLIRETPWVKISSAGVVYQTRFVNNAKAIEYRFLSAGVWSGWRHVMTFARAGRFFLGLFPSPSPLMTINTFGDTLGINARDGDQDVLIRVADADGPSPVVSLDPIGTACTTRYDYPTLVFDKVGKAVTSYCAGKVAYEQ